MRLQSKLALALGPLVAGPVLALGWLAYASFSADLARDASARLDVAIASAERQADALLHEMLSHADLLAASPELEAYARAPDTVNRAFLEEPALLKQAYRYLKAFPAYRQICFLDTNGSVDACAQRDGSTALTPQADALTEARKSDDGTAVIVASCGTDHCLHVYRRILLSPHYERPRDGRWIEHGFLALTLSMETAFADPTPVSLNPRERLIIAHNDGDTIRDTANAANGGRLAPPLQDLVLDDSLGSHSTSLIIDGETWLARAAPIPPDLVAIALLAESAVTEPLGELAAQTLVVTLLGMVLMAAAVMSLLRRMVLEPTRALQRATRRIAEGDLHPQIQVRRHDELGDLADALRRMGEELDHSRARIEEFAFRDQLTGLPNRRGITDLLSARIAEANESGRCLAVMFIDLDNFKQINDTLGHSAGDRILATIAKRITAELQPFDAAAGRFGGDEILLVLDAGQCRQAAESLAQTILNSCREPVEIGDSAYVVTTSVGISFYPDDGRDIEALVRRADLAMYEAKAHGRDEYRFYSAVMDANSTRTLVIENALRHAIARGELRLLYQPIVELHSNQIVSFEALLRWTNDALGNVSPDEFIPVAEQSGTIDRVGHWVLEEACRQMRAWRDQGLMTVPVAVNVSASQMRHQALAKAVLDCIEQHGLEPQALHVEITESTLMDRTKEVKQRLDDLCALGFAVHVDDFGTGYSSLGYLRRFSVDCLKIDRSFISHLTSAETDRALVAAILSLSSALGLRVIAEGIETPEQKELLELLGCDLGQGYLFGKPQPAEQAATWLVPLPRSLVNNR